MAASYTRILYLKLYVIRSLFYVNIFQMDAQRMLKTGITNTIREMCSCNFTSSDLEESEVTCSADDNSTMTFTTTVVYSTESGDMTASTLIQMFQDRAASTNTVISVGSQTATIVSVCTPSCIPEPQPSPTSTPELQLEGPSPTLLYQNCQWKNHIQPYCTRDTSERIWSNCCFRATSGKAKSNHCTRATRSKGTTDTKCSYTSGGIPGRACYWYHYLHHCRSHLVSWGIIHHECSQLQAASQVCMHIPPCGIADVTVNSCVSLA